MTFEYHFHDNTSAIARAKAIRKVRGPMDIACHACGDFFDERKRDEHIRVCRQSPQSKTVKCRKCGKELDETRLVTHLKREHPLPLRPAPPPRKKKVKRRKK